MDYLLHHRALTWVEEAAERLRQGVDTQYQVDKKTSPSDLVTEYDRKIEAFLVEKIRKYYPDHQIIGEEADYETSNPQEGTVWVIDPIDGTMNFVKEGRDFAIMVGIYQDGQPLAGYIYDVMMKEFYFGIVGEGAYCNYRRLATPHFENLSESLILVNLYGIIAKPQPGLVQLVSRGLGVRGLGSAAIELIRLIRGEAGIYVSYQLQPWDFAAGVAICKAMGYSATDHQGQFLPIDRPSQAIFCHPNIHQEAIQLLSNH